MCEVVQPYETKKNCEHKNRPDLIILGYIKPAGRITGVLENIF